MKILVADDEPISVLYLQAALEDWAIRWSPPATAMPPAKSCRARTRPCSPS